MNRRNFLGGLAACLAACTAPQVLLDRKLWKVPKGKLIAVINPAWVNAPYEIGFYTDAVLRVGPRPTVLPVTVKKGQRPDGVGTLPWAPRFDESGKFVLPFIFQKTV